MVGDRFDTDIAFGKNAGMKTLLVLSGVSSQADLEKRVEQVQRQRQRAKGEGEGEEGDVVVPDFYASSLAALLSGA